MRSDNRPTLPNTTKEKKILNLIQELNLKALVRDSLFLESLLNWSRILTEREELTSKKIKRIFAQYTTFCSFFYSTTRLFCTKTSHCTNKDTSVRRRHLIAQLESSLISPFAFINPVNTNQRSNAEGNTEDLTKNIAIAVQESRSHVVLWSEKQNPSTFNTWFTRISQFPHQHPIQLWPQTRMQSKECYFDDPKSESVRWILLRKGCTGNPGWG